MSASARRRAVQESSATQDRGQARVRSAWSTLVRRVVGETGTGAKPPRMLVSCSALMSSPSERLAKSPKQAPSLMSDASVLVDALARCGGVGVADESVRERVAQQRLGRECELVAGLGEVGQRRDQRLEVGDRVVLGLCGSHPSRHLRAGASDSSSLTRSSRWPLMTVSASGRSSSAPVIAAFCLLVSTARLLTFSSDVSSAALLSSSCAEELRASS